MTTFLYWYEYVCFTILGNMPIALAIILTVYLAKRPRYLTYGYNYFGVRLFDGWDERGDVAKRTCKLVAAAGIIVTALHGMLYMVQMVAYFFEVLTDPDELENSWLYWLALIENEEIEALDLEDLGSEEYMAVMIMLYVGSAFLGFVMGLVQGLFNALFLLFLPAALHPILTARRSNGWKIPGSAYIGVVVYCILVFIIPIVGNGLLMVVMANA